MQFLCNKKEQKAKGIEVIGLYRVLDTLSNETFGLFKGQYYLRWQHVRESGN